MATIGLRQKGGKVLLRIAHNGVRRYIPLPVKIEPKNWNVKYKRVGKNEPDHQKINEYLAGVLSRANSIMGDHEREHVGDADTIKKAIKEAIFEGKKLTKKTFIEYFYEIIENHTAHDRHERAETQGVVVKHLQAFAEYEGFKTVRFRQLSPEFVRRFSAFLAMEYDNQHNTRVKKLKGVKAVVNSAIREGYMPATNHPFKDVDLREIEGKKERLTKEELESIENMELEERSVIWHARNVFCMQVYTAGTRIGDMCMIKWSNIKKNRIDFRQIKTNVDQDMALPESAIKILNWYEYRKEEGRSFIFPYMDEEDLSDKLNRIAARDRVRSKINKQLLNIEMELDLPRHITSHVARHTFADLAQKAGMPIYLISKALGHKSIKQTERYLASFDTEGVDNMLKQLF